MRKELRVLSLLVLIGIVACDLSTEPEVRTAANQFSLQATWRADVRGTGGSKITGSTELRDYRAYYDGEITLNGAAPSRSYNWRIFPGTCQSSETTVVGESTLAFPPLVTNATGSARVTQLFSSHLNLQANAAYNVRVLTGTAITTTVACGELRRS